MLNLNMTLYYVFTNSFKLNPELYNCSNANEGENKVNHLYIGWYFLISGILLIIIYLPCLIVMLKSKCRAPSFQLMILLAIFDLLSITVNSVITGIMGIKGVTFCDYPLFTFCAGAVGLTSWIGCCLVCILLAVDRCVEINENFPLAFMMRKNVFRAVMLVVIALSISIFLFTNPVVFNLDYCSWFFDPQLGQSADIYHNTIHTVNNLLISVVSTPLYVYLCYQLIFKFGYATSMWMYRSKRQIIIQAVIMCFFHALSSYIYVYMQFFHSPHWLVILGQLGWQWSNGCVCLAYYTLNRTIRNAAVRMLLSKKTREKFGLHMGIDEMIEAERQAENNNREAMETAKVAPFLS